MLVFLVLVSHGAVFANLRLLFTFFGEFVCYLFCCLVFSTCWFTLVGFCLIVCYRLLIVCCGLVSLIFGLGCLIS